MEVVLQLQFGERLAVSDQAVILQIRDHRLIRNGQPFAKLLTVRSNLRLLTLQAGLADRFKIVPRLRVRRRHTNRGRSPREQPQPPRIGKSM